MAPNTLVHVFRNPLAVYAFTFDSNGSDLPVDPESPWSYHCQLDELDSKFAPHLAEMAARITAHGPQFLQPTDEKSNCSYPQTVYLWACGQVNENRGGWGYEYWAAAGLTLERDSSKLPDLDYPWSYVKALPPGLLWGFPVYCGAATQALEKNGFYFFKMWMGTSASQRSRPLAYTGLFAVLNSTRQPQQPTAFDEAKKLDEQLRNK